MTEWIQAGSPAPDFTLSTDEGSSLTLSDLRGQSVVLYFYPKDDTPGCTKQACAFRDRQSELAGLQTRVLGVSPDGIESHSAFREKYGLNFTLLADPDHAVAEAYGAWREKTLYGRKSLGIQRSTFVIDHRGVVSKLWKRVAVDGHDTKILEALKSLAAE